MLYLEQEKKICSVFGQKLFQQCMHKKMIFRVLPINDITNFATQVTKSLQYSEAARGTETNTK